MSCCRERKAPSSWPSRVMTTSCPAGSRRASLNSTLRQALKPCLAIASWSMQTATPCSRARSPVSTVPTRHGWASTSQVSSSPTLPCRGQSSCIAEMFSSRWAGMTKACWSRTGTSTCGSPLAGPSNSLTALWPRIGSMTRTPRSSPKYRKRWLQDIRRVVSKRRRSYGVWPRLLLDAQALAARVDLIGANGGPVRVSITCGQSHPEGVHHR